MIFLLAVLFLAAVAFIAWAEVQLDAELAGAQ